MCKNKLWRHENKKKTTSVEWGRRESKKCLKRHNIKRLDIAYVSINPILISKRSNQNKYNGRILKPPHVGYNLQAELDSRNESSINFKMDHQYKKPFCWVAKEIIVRVPQLHAFYQSHTIIYVCRLLANWNACCVFVCDQ